MLRRGLVFNFNHPKTHLVLHAGFNRRFRNVPYVARKDRPLLAAVAASAAGIAGEVVMEASAPVSAVIAVAGIFRGGLARPEGLVAMIGVFHLGGHRLA